MSAADELLELAREASVGVRKPMGWAGLSVGLMAITPDVITVRVWTRRPDVAAQDPVPGVRRALLRCLGTALPCPSMLAIYTNEAAGIVEVERTLPFHTRPVYERPRHTAPPRSLFRRKLPVRPEDRWGELWDEMVRESSINRELG